MATAGAFIAIIQKKPINPRFPMIKPFGGLPPKKFLKLKKKFDLEEKKKIKRRSQ